MRNINAQGSNFVILTLKPLWAANQCLRFRGFWELLFGCTIAIIRRRIFTPSTLSMILHVTRAEHVDGHRVHLWFNDGGNGEVDFSEVLDGPIFEPLKDIDYFKQFQLIGHTLAWNNGADFAPEYLRGLVHTYSAA